MSGDLLTDYSCHYVILCSICHDVEASPSKSVSYFCFTFRPLLLQYVRKEVQVYVEPERNCKRFTTMVVQVGRHAFHQLEPSNGGSLPRRLRVKNSCLLFCILLRRKKHPQLEVETPGRYPTPGDPCLQGNKHHIESHSNHLHSYLKLIKS